VIRTRERDKGTSYVGTAVDGYGKGGSYGSFFPSVRNRLLQKSPIFPELTTIIRRHGKTCS